MGVEKANGTIIEGVQYLVHFYSTQIQTASSSKKGEKRAKNKKLRFAKKLSFFCMFTSWTLFWGSIRIEKIGWGRCACQNFFLTFRQQSIVSNFGKGTPR